MRRIQLWLGKAARGELHDTAQPPDPLFASQLEIIVPRAALLPATDPIELIGLVRPDNKTLIITRTMAETGPRGKGLPGFVVIGFRAQPQSMTRLRHAPVTLAGLHAELQQAGINLIDEMKLRLKAWAGIANDSVRRLSSRLAILVAFPTVTMDGKTTDDLRAFISLKRPVRLASNGACCITRRLPALPAPTMCSSARFLKPGLCPKRHQNRARPGSSRL